MKLEEMRKVLNFRELGGYEDKDGRKVVHGQFYRCGAMADLNEEELEYVKSLGIKHVFDFRSAFEADDLPDPDIGAQYHQLNALLDENGNAVQFDPKGIEKAVRGGDIGENFLAMMYARLPFAGAYKKMFDVIKKNETPILFHCSAGKDRTGIAAVLILLLLGVDEQTALDDYELTNEYRTELIEAFLKKMEPMFVQKPELREAMKSFEGVVRSSAELSLQTVLDKYGSYDQFFEKEFGIDEKLRDELKNTYLE